MDTWVQYRFRYCVVAQEAATDTSNRPEGMSALRWFVGS